METKYWSHLTEEERGRGLELAEPFNDAYRRPDDWEISTSMYVDGLTESGFVFNVVDDFSDDSIVNVREKDLEKFLAEYRANGFRCVRDYCGPYGPLYYEPTPIKLMLQRTLQFIRHLWYRHIAPPVVYDITEAELRGEEISMEEVLGVGDSQAATNR